MTKDDQDRIPAGYVRRAHGIHGDVVVRGMLQDAEDRFVPGAVLTTDEDIPRGFEIVGVRGHQGDYIVTFNEIGDRTTADGLRDPVHDRSCRSAATRSGGVVARGSRGMRCVLERW